MGFRNWLLKGLFNEAGWPYTPPPSPAGSNWEVIERSFENLKNGVLADYSKVGDPYHTISTVHACIDKTAKNIAKVPVQYQVNGDPREDGPVYRLLNNPTPREDRYRFWMSLVASLERTGKAYVVGQGFRQTTEGRVPSVFFVVPGNRMSYDKDNKTFFTGSGQNKKEYRERDVVAISYLDGHSPLESARFEVMLLFYAMQYNINFFKNGGQLPGFLRKRDSGRAMTPERQKEIEHAFKTRGGKDAGDKRQVPVFNDLDWVSIGESQKDMDYLQLVNTMERRITKVMGVPYALFDETDTTFSNMGEARKHFYESKLLPIMRQVEAVFDDQITDRWGWSGVIRFDIDSIPELQTNVAAVSESALRYYQMGVPFEVINERMSLGFPEFDPREPTFQLAQEKRKEIAWEENTRKAIKHEKQIALDPVLRAKEGAAVLEYMKTQSAPLQKDVSQFFKQLYRPVRDKLRELIEERDEKATTKVFNENLSFDEDKFGLWMEGEPWDEMINGVVTKHLQRIFEYGFNRTVSGFGVDFSLPPDKVQAFVANRAMKMQQMTNEVKEEIRAAIVKAVEDGASADELERRLSQKFTTLERSRAKAIANTETTAAYNGGRFDGMKELKIERKEWLHTGDSGPHVRENHKAITGEKVGINDSFSIGVDYPGGNGPASEVVNCRCTVLPVILDEDEERILEEARRRRG